MSQLYPRPMSAYTLPPYRITRPRCQAHCCPRLSRVPLHRCRCHRRCASAARARLCVRCSSTAGTLCRCCFSARCGSRMLLLLLCVCVCLFVGVGVTAFCLCAALLCCAESRPWRNGPHFLKRGTQTPSMLFAVPSHTTPELRCVQQQQQQHLRASGVLLI